MQPTGENMMPMTGIAATITALALAATLLVPITTFVKSELQAAAAPARTTAPISLLQR
ncbi:MAG: hypothetical protein ACKVP7_11020 [Hyphomicrobiaceae bacterium]